MYNPWPVSVVLDHPEGHVLADGSRQESCYLAGNESVWSGVRDIREVEVDLASPSTATRRVSCWIIMLYLEGILYREEGKYGEGGKYGESG